MNRPNWTNRDGSPRPAREYAPGRWTGMLFGEEVRLHMARRAADRRSFEAELDRDFGPGVRCPACQIALSTPGMACPDCPPMQAPEVALQAASGRMGILPDHAHSGLWNFDGQTLVEWATKWAASWPPATLYVVLQGPKGNGKTHMSVALLREVAALHGRYGTFAEMSEVLYRLRNASSRDSEVTTESILAPLRTAPLLVLDDVGIGNWTPFAHEALWLLIGFRYARRLPTIITANPEGLAMLDERVRDRLQDVRISEVVQFGGRNRRAA